MELNITKHIKDYWIRIKGLSDIEKEEFNDATSENSVRTSEFLKSLNLGPLMPVINKYYSVKEGKEKYPRIAMIKTLILKKIKRIKFFTSTEKYLETNPDEAIELGFDVNSDGQVIVPDHETLRHFEKVRLGNEGMDKTMEAFCIQVVNAGNKLGLKIGENTGTDSTPIEVPHDPDAAYNGHYKKIMVKAHITEDYDHNIPLAKKICGGTENDDPYLEFMLDKTAISAKNNMNESWFDGGYNSHKNIALVHIKFGLKPHYPINDGWRENVKYEHTFDRKKYVLTPEEEINYLYSKRWRETYYKTDASLEYKMQCLIKEELYEPVSVYFRNSYIQEYEECPDGVLDVYHRRNGNEGVNSYLKEYLGLETHINGKRFKNIDIHATGCCIAMLAVALIRLQHGIKKNLSSVAYLT